MTIGFGLFLIAVGAILRFAVTATVAGIDIQTVGVILMVVGAIAFVISLVLEFNRRSGRPAAAASARVLTRTGASVARPDDRRADRAGLHGRLAAERSGVDRVVAVA